LALSITSREQFEVISSIQQWRIAVPLLAIFVQAYLPLKLSFFQHLRPSAAGHDLFCGGAAQSDTGLLTGMIIGLVQDSLTHSFLGLYGISKTVVGLRLRRLA